MAANGCNGTNGNAKAHLPINQWRNDPLAGSTEAEQFHSAMPPVPTDAPAPEAQA